MTALTGEDARASARGPKLDRTDASAHGDEVLEITDLRTQFFTRDGIVRAVDGVDLTVRMGKTLCIVGESGCGKSVTARSVLQLIDPPGRIVEGRIRWRRPVRRGDRMVAGDRWVDLLGLDARGDAMRRIRGAEIGMIFQEPVASLSPMYTIGDQLTEAIRLHLPLSKEGARERALAQLRRVGIPQPERRMSAYSFQLSGGMCQRVMIAMALSSDPALLIADEPTTALDVTTQARILDLLAELQRETGMSMLFITHDLGVVAEIADEVAVMYLGIVAERGPVGQIFEDPKHPYTQALLRSLPKVGDRRRRRLPAIRGMIPHPQQRPTGCPFHTRCEHAMPGLCDVVTPGVSQVGPAHAARCHLHTLTPEQALRYGKPSAGAAELGVVLAAPIFSVADPADGVRRRPPDATAEPLLSVHDVKKHFPLGRGLFRRDAGAVRAVDGVDLEIRPGETLGVVGESGCGKTTLARCIVRILAPTAGRIHYRRSDGHVVDLATLSERQLRPLRREIRMIFQDPYSCLNPRMTLLELIGEPLRNTGMARGSELQDRVAQMLRKVGLRPEYMRRYPHAFSGGERQRINIARALITGPRLVIADEPVSALDASVRAQILNLLADLRDELGLTYLFISHDLSVVEHLCDRVAVMYLGRIVETAETEVLYAAPRHPYTEALLAAVPKADPRERRTRRFELPDDLPDPADPPSGCVFRTRCAYVRPERCATEVPPLRGPAADRLSACHYADELSLAGVSIEEPSVILPSAGAIDPGGSQSNGR